MALLGPLVVVAENPAAETVEALGNTGAFPIVEARWADAGAAIDEIQPCALLLAEPEPAPEPRLAEDLTRRIEAMSPLMPVLARLRQDGALATRSGRRSRWRRSSPATISAPWWRGWAPIPRLRSAEAGTNLSTFSRRDRPCPQAQRSPST
jgi:hypothetical protein